MSKDKGQKNIKKAPDDKNSGKTQKEIYDILDEYSIKLDKLSKEEE